MLKKKFITLLKKEDGAGLVLALMVFVVLAVLGIAVSALTIGSRKLSDINRNSNSAYYIAEAGANLAYDEIKNGIRGLLDFNIAAINIEANKLDGKIYEDRFDLQFGKRPTATIRVKENPSLPYEGYTIESTGKIGSTSRTVEKHFSVRSARVIGLPPPPPDKAVIVPGTFDTGAATIDPDLLLQDSEFDMTPYRSIQFPDIPDYNDYVKYDTYTVKAGSEISENTFINNLVIGNNNTLTINTNGQDINLVANDITLGNASRINIIGEGTVNIYVNNSIYNKSNVNNIVLNEGRSPNYLNLFYAGTLKLDMKNNVIINGSFFIKTADLEIEKKLTVTGVLLSYGNITIGTDASIDGVIYAPAENTTLTLGNNASFEGVIIAENLILEGTATIEYVEHTYLETYPFGMHGDDTTGSSAIIFDATPAIEIGP